jgi:uncharacterized membrane protein YeaQ/YmgE (transglycosylase-associated protein family)
METLLGLIGATVLGAVAWWAGAHVGLMTAFVLSTIGSGAGMYVGRRLARDHLI